MSLKRTFLSFFQQRFWRDDVKYQQPQGYESSDKRAKISKVCHEAKF